MPIFNLEKLKECLAEEEAIYFAPFYLYKNKTEWLKRAEYELGQISAKIDVQNEGIWIKYVNFV